MDLGKVPPQDIEAEQAVIGSMLTDQDAVSSAIETLKPEDFYREDPFFKNNVITYSISELDIHYKVSYAENWFQN